MSTLLVASAGGHLKQLHRLVPRIEGLEEQLTWVTYSTSQSESLLAGQQVLYAHPVESRDYLGVARNARFAARLLRKHRFERVVSTGSAIALAFLPVARSMNVPCHYIESAARSLGPSTTGSLLRWLPGARLYTQYRTWATGRWRYLGSVFDAFEAHDHDQPIGSPTRVVVCLGTSEQYGFPRLVQRMVDILPPSADVLWQTGATRLDGLRIAARAFVPADELERGIAEADVVVTHAGTGTALAALEAGKAPVLVPRSKAHHENVDDHQALISAELARRGLAIDARPDTLELGHLQAAMRRRITERSDAPPLRLVPD